MIGDCHFHFGLVIYLYGTRRADYQGHRGASDERARLPFARAGRRRQRERRWKPAAPISKRGGSSMARGQQPVCRRPAAAAAAGVRRQQPKLGGAAAGREARDVNTGGSGAGELVVVPDRRPLVPGIALGGAVR